MRFESVDDDYQVEHWTRQIRMGCWIAIVISTVGAVRVFLDWPEPSRWLVLVIGAAVLAQAGLLWLPWARIIRRRHAREWLFLWWLLELPLLYVFARGDEAALAIFPAGAIVVMVTAAVLYPPVAIAGLGVLSVGAFLTLAHGHPDAQPTMVAGLVAVLVSVVATCVLTAQGRLAQDTRRRAAEDRTEALLQNASDLVLAVGEDGEVTYASPSARELLGRDPAWITGDRLGQMVHPEDLPQAREFMSALFAGGREHTGRIETRLRHGDGTWVYTEAIGVNRLCDPNLRAAVLSIRDVGARKYMEAELTRQAFTDSLTGLPNRALFHDRVSHAAARHHRESGRITLMLIDLDDFKLVNDGLGHTAGDQLLRVIAQRLSAQLRPADTLARLGGDEFAVLIEDLTELEAAELADRLVRAVREPVTLGVRDVICTASIGISVIKAGTHDLGEADELLRDADLAMYAAKAAGRDGYAVFDPATHADVLAEAEQRAALERALLEEQFVVHYQPIVELPARELIGFEALVRWNHPVNGLVGPLTFIPLAEATGLIVPLGRWVLDQACRQLAAWTADHPEAAKLRMSVNLSPRQFQHSGLVSEVAGIIERTGVPADKLVLEITESLLMKDTEATVRTLEALKALGVRLAVDDFGTGYSSLSYLKRFPVDILKIDRSFVDGITADAGDATLAEAVVQLGRTLQLQTVAEGIETADQWSTLRELGCEYGQGYLFARPVAADEIVPLIRSRPSGHVDPIAE
ncbi:MULTISPECIES: putative bifunctional diguanylate cyclase/phosphodiesterase [Catenuloplanes]|uniref:Diguanylate cyclase (GGDEF)-like protein/PAS domain S-box-containing protein n=1 Tax=Catenuloplanes niger TaxID=587534 RepID=A0AAE4CWD4_9ACTN|nr:bifunctional diguanylate cyclase/phosphodiesterase [Catenuloplanes niger]MDR7326382.1 diguanylate cyclase (GGDEF)-like protein/PAS domain S-box-containing protein [Catenuloplanes niger]